MITEAKRKAGRPPGVYGRYVQDHLRQQRYQVTIPQWLIDAVREKAKNEGISVGRLIEKTLLKNDKKLVAAGAAAFKAGIKGK